MQANQIIEDKIDNSTVAIEIIEIQGSQISAHVVYTIFFATRSKVRKQLHVCA